MSDNGQLRDDELAYIDEHTRLALPAARVWERMRQVAARDGVTIRATPSTICPGIAGYRDLDMQQWLIDHPAGPAPIAPLGRSTHGYGTVVDVDRGLAWMRQHGTDYGLTFDTIRDEPWHVLITAPAWAHTDLTPITDPDQEDTMRNSGFYYKRDGKTINVIANTSSGFYHEFESADGGYNTPVAQAFDVPASFAPITPSHAAKLADDCRAVRTA